MPTGHPFAELDGVIGRRLAKEPLLLAEEAMAPEFNQFTVEMCRAAGFTPTVYRGPWRASGRPPTSSPPDAAFTACRPPASPRSPGPSAAPDRPASDYPWSVLWRAADDSGHVRAVVACAQAMSKRLGWLTPASQPTQSRAVVP